MRKWFCAQVGAREHFAVPRALQRNGELAVLYTDFWAGPMVQGLAKIGVNRALRSLSTRFHPDLAAADVRSWNIRSIIDEGWVRRRKGSAYEDFLVVGATFAKRVREALKKRFDLNRDTLFFSYDTAALEAMEYCRLRGVRCVLGQMDPNRLEVELVREEEKGWPGWTSQPLNVPEDYFRRREQEWAFADTVMVNSVFCRQALLQQGVPARKLVVVPLCFETSTETRTMDRRLRPTGQPLRVLFLGQVILRKGIQYLMQAAKLLEGENIQFDVVGPLGISESAVASAPRNMIFHGRATRDQIHGWYRQSDVFVLPTLSDGFAITQLEAMSHGLPVVTTPCCGAVVTDAVDGFIVPTRSADALARKLQCYLADRELLSVQQQAASKKVMQFSLDHLAANLRALEI